MDKAGVANSIAACFLIVFWAGTSASEPARDGVSSSDSSLPTYIRLAYRPSKPVSLLDLPGDLLAVQLIAVSSKRALEDYARSHGLKGLSAARIAQGGKLRYVLILGLYENRDHARTAIDAMPPPLNELSAWIRPLSSLQVAIVGGDELAEHLGE